MAESSSGESKDQKATPHRLRKAREKGQVSQSRELTGAVALLVATVALVLALPAIGANIHDLFHHAVTMIVHGETGTLSGATWQAAYIFMASSMLVVVAVVAMSLLVARIQVGPVFSLEPLRPKLSHINPTVNAKQIFSMRSLVRIAMILLKILVLGVGFALIVPFFFADAIRIVLGGQGAALEVTVRSVLAFMTWGLLAFLILSFLDFAFQRYQFTKDQRMSMREVKREHKELEGNPLVKSARKTLAREPSITESLQYLHLTNLLLTAPDGRVMALYYNPGQFEGLPVVIVKAGGPLGQAVQSLMAGYPTTRRSDLDLMQRLWPVTHNSQTVPQPYARVITDLMARSGQP